MYTESLLKLAKKKDLKNALVKNKKWLLELCEKSGTLKPIFLHELRRTPGQTSLENSIIKFYNEYNVQFWVKDNNNITIAIYSIRITDSLAGEMIEISRIYLPFEIMLVIEEINEAYKLWLDYIEKYLIGKDHHKINGNRMAGAGFKALILFPNKRSPIKHQFLCLPNKYYKDTIWNQFAPNIESFFKEKGLDFFYHPGFYIDR